MTNTIIEIKHREIAKRFLDAHSGEPNDEELALLLAIHEEEIANQYTKYHLTIEDELRQQRDAMYALASGGKNLFAFNLEDHLTQVLSAFKIMKEAWEAAKAANYENSNH